ncbi:MAG TPA: DUF4056 domain-containing protein [Anaerohalosphaeraceae bacterium]|nr:DUF4056 domain-containing protein [Anaerohalosphaeraceae bacterium]HOL87592.1 DUF4056 domain-containing protein [Anaerohalosphaeraceae bacterium]HPP56170.1 DUF4056 domain-containing protein [Anaerohalosphaeraceae bacterium]
MSCWVGRVLSAAGIIAVLVLGGCGLDGGPRPRWGFTPKQYYGDPNNLGTHSYGYGGREGYGILYTLRGGTIDPDHLRGTADLTRHTYLKAYDAILSGRSRFQVGPAFELTTNVIRLTYPSDWMQRPRSEREKIAREAALIIAPAVAYHSYVWHEMLTWQGLRFALIEPEHESAFSWEDLYSNALGAHLAVRAVQRGAMTVPDYNQAMTELIRQTLEELQVVSRLQALAYLERMRGKWFTADKLLRRQMDIGFETGRITPCLIPGLTDQPPVSLPWPNLDGLEAYGLGVLYTLRSPYLEAAALKRRAGIQGELEPLKHFPLIMESIKKEAREKFGYLLEE